MPLLFLERFPWPSLQTYTALSVALLAGSIFSAYTTVTDPGFGALETDEAQPPSEVERELLKNDISNTELATTVLWYLVTDSLFVWVSDFSALCDVMVIMKFIQKLMVTLLSAYLQVLVNTFCCSLMLIAKMIQYVVFGPLRVSEKQVSLCCYSCFYFFQTRSKWSLISFPVSFFFGSSAPER